MCIITSVWVAGFVMDLASNVILTWTFFHAFIPGPEFPIERDANSSHFDLAVVVILS
jgi:hypothetical protein